MSLFCEINAIESLPVEIISFRLDPAAMATGKRAVDPIFGLREED